MNVRLDLVCERPFQQTGLPIALDGCSHVSAMNLFGPGAAGCETQIVELEGEVDGTTVHTDVRVVGLGGYILTKAAAAYSRGLDKDFYDFAFVLLYNNNGGPASAARALGTDAFSGLLEARRDVLVRVLAAYAAPESPGSEAFVREWIRVDPTADSATLAQDAVGAALEFSAALEFGADHG